MTSTAKTFAPKIQAPRADALPWLAGTAVLEQTAPAWVRALRATGAESFGATGLPALSWEGWQYTNLRAFAAGGFTYAVAPAAVEAAQLPAPLLADGYRVVVVNGQWRADLSRLPDGVTVRSLLDAADDAGVQEELATVGDLETSPFVALNAAYLRDGFVLDVARGRDVDAAVEVLFWYTGGDTAAYPRVLYRLGENSGVTLLEHHAGTGRFFANLYTGVVLQPAARGRVYRLLADMPAACFYSRTVVRAQKGARFEGFSLVSALEAGRQEYRMQLLDAGVSANIGGLYMLKGQESHDFTILADHFEPDGTSQQYFKGVIDDKARAVFQGKIHVHRPAQRTDGYQSHHALLLAGTAEANAKPELEIYADDVKCSHGATAGMLSAEALFYLQSRGIPAEEARNLLIRSFLGETIENITHNDIRAVYAARVEGWLAARAGGA